jgi:hypothetical protein
MSLGWEVFMRASGAVGALILAIAVYFSLFWGYDALRILTSPTYGLEDVWRSQVVFGIGRFAGLDPNGLLRLAAALGALKLTVAGVCAIHIVDRVRSLVSGTPSNEILETGLLIAVAITLVSVAPAIWSQNGDLVRELLIQFMLAALAAVLCIMERTGRKPKDADKTETALETAIAAHKAAAVSPASGRWFAPWRR